jgi:hypothetical protein
MHACVLSDIKSLHVTYYGWQDLPQGLWIINEYFKYNFIGDYLEKKIYTFLRHLIDKTASAAISKIA